MGRNKHVRFMYVLDHDYRKTSVGTMVMVYTATVREQKHNTRSVARKGVVTEREERKKRVKKSQRRTRLFEMHQVGVH